jgi:hypothetical protein
VTLLRTNIERNDRQSEDSWTDDMVWITGGTFRIGSNNHYLESACTSGFDRRFLDRPNARDEPAIQGFHQGDKLQDIRRNRAGS